MSSRPPNLPATAFPGPDPLRATSSSSTTNLKTRFLLLSDTHSHPLHPPTDTAHAYRSPLPSADVLLHAGDLSFAGELEEYRRTLDVVRSSDAELKIVIPGNHDWSLDERYVKENFAGERFWDAPEPRRNAEWVQGARSLWMGEEARAAGVVYLEEGVWTFGLRSGVRFTIYTQPYTPAFCNMAFPYERHHDRFNPPVSSPSPNPDFNPPNPAPSWPAIDIMLSHGPPMHHMDNVVRFDLGRTMPVGCINQLHALTRVKPRLSVFGHIHEGWGAQFVRWNGRKRTDVSREQDMVEALGGGWDEMDRGMELEPREGGEVERVEVKSSDEDVLEKGFAYVDASEEGGRPVKWGEESLLVNAAILNRGGRPVNAPWVVDLDLPKASVNVD